MSSKKTIDPNSFEHKIKVLQKLYDSGCKTERTCRVYQWNRY